MLLEDVFQDDMAAFLFLSAIIDFSNYIPFGRRFTC
jgi:hypothetical protein